MQPQAARPAVESLQSRRGLDWLVFFVADIQTGFGPFVAVFLTTQKWTQVDIGLVLTIGGLVSLIGQLPLGAVVDAARSVRVTAALSLVAIGASAAAFAAWPIFPVVLASRLLHAVASCTLGLALVSISLGLAGETRISTRLGRNAAFASAGTGIAAGVMGATGYYVSSTAVFFLAGALVLPALFALSRIRPAEIGPASDASHGMPMTPAFLAAGLAELIRNRQLVVFAICVVLFHLSNAAMLPLAASMVTLRSSQAATIMVAAAIVVPQFVVTLLSPWIGRWAERWGRRPLLLLGFGALVVRGFLFGATNDPQLLTLIQVLDGVRRRRRARLCPRSSDYRRSRTRGHGHFNLTQGAVGSAMGVGAATSTTLTGYVSDKFGSHAAFNMLAMFAALGFAVIVLAMAETKPQRLDAEVAADD